MEVVMEKDRVVSLLENKRIFVVEDNLQNRIIFQILLTGEGARVEFDRWGRDTITRLQGFMPIDLIILDLMLGGGVTGYDIFEQLRTFPQFAQTPVVAVSAAETSIAIPKTREMGFSGFIAKPLNNERFPQQLLSIMQGEPIWHAGGPMV
jgi:CheY-like chemotaxis protein